MKRKEEENKKTWEEAQGTDPMDTDIPGTSSDAPLTRGNFPLGELGLGAFTPSKARKVANMNSFRFDKDLGKIVQQSIRRLHVSRVAPLSVTTEKFVVKNIKDDPLAIALAGVAFTQVSEKNLKNMM
jgi:hypothetical protein